MDGNTGTADFTTANTVVSLVIPGVANSEAVELNKLIDKDTVDGSPADLKGAACSALLPPECPRSIPTRRTTDPEIEAPATTGREGFKVAA